MNLLEKRIGKKVAETVDQLGEIIKDYAQKQTRLIRRVSDLEAKGLTPNRKDSQELVKKPERKLSSRNF